MHVRTRNDIWQEPFHAEHQNAVINSNTVIAVYKFDRRCTIDRVSFLSVAGLAADGTNFVVIRASKSTSGTPIIASWSTESGQQGSLPANDSIDLVNTITSQDLTFEAGDIVALDVTVAGTGALPAGQLHIDGRYI